MKGIRVWLSAAVLSIACPTLSLSAGQGDGPGVPDRRQRVAREREVRQQRFSARIDSLVSSGEFQFLPVSMMWSPRMQSQIIDGYYYYVGIFKEQLQVHMPVVVGRALTYNAIANFDTDSLSGYRNEKNDTGWKVSFSAEDDLCVRFYDLSGDGPCRAGYDIRQQSDSVYRYDRRERCDAPVCRSGAADEKRGLRPSDAGERLIRYKRRALRKRPSLVMG